VEFTSQIFTPATEFFVIPVFRPEQSPECTGTEWQWNSVTGMNTKNCQIWQVLHFKMKNSNKISKKNRDGVVILLGYCLHGLCAFPNMVSSENIVKISGKKEK
jgi:hypothetical protein